MNAKIFACTLLIGSFGFFSSGIAGSPAQSPSSAASALDVSISKNIEKRFQDIQDLIKRNGAFKAFSELNGLSVSPTKDSENIEVQEADKTGADRGGPLVCVEEGKIVVSPSTPANIGKDVLSESPTKEIVATLQATPDDRTQKVTVTVNGVTYEAWGRRALDESIAKATAEELKTKTKYVCYIPRNGA